MTLTVGDRLRLLRAAKNLSQARLAELAGIEPATLSRTETSKRTPRALTVQVLAEALGVRVEALHDDTHCIQEVARIAGVTLKPEVGEGPLVDEARRVAYRMSNERQVAVALMVRGWVAFATGPPSPEQPAPSRTRPAADGGRKKDDKSSA